MELPATARVDASDGTFGRMTSIVFDPKKETITHLVVAEMDLPHTQHLVPIDLVIETTPRSVKLRCTRQAASRLANFIETEYIQGEFTRYESNPAFLPLEPMEIPVNTHILVEHRRIPPGELTIDEGARVEATDGHIGHVDEVIVDSAEGHLTHLILRIGHLWGQRDVAIPVEQIARFVDDTVFLRLSKDQVGALPAAKLQDRHS
jgi:sporulation protein YlmC with PRC-barrel domain